MSFLKSFVKISAPRKLTEARAKTISAAVLKRAGLPKEEKHVAHLANTILTEGHRSSVSELIRHLNRRTNKYSTDRKAVVKKIISGKRGIWY
jgi:hypothetical protein